MAGTSVTNNTNMWFWLLTFRARPTRHFFKFPLRSRIYSYAYVEGQIQMTEFGLRTVKKGIDEAQRKLDAGEYPNIKGTFKL